MGIKLTIEANSPSTPPIPERLTHVPDEIIVRVSRLLVYEGTAAWMKATLGAKHAAIQGVGPSRLSPFPCGSTLECQAEELEIIGPGHYWDRTTQEDKP